MTGTALISYNFSYQRGVDLAFGCTDTKSGHIRLHRETPMLYTTGYVKKNWKKVRQFSTAMFQMASIVENINMFIFLPMDYSLWTYGIISQSTWSISLSCIVVPAYDCWYRVLARKNKFKTIRGWHVPNYGIHSIRCHVFFTRKRGYQATFINNLGDILFRFFVLQFLGCLASCPSFQRWKTSQN